MSDANDHARVVLGTIIPDRIDLLEVALQHIEPEYILDATLQGIFVLLRKYHELAGGVLSHSALNDILARQVDAGKLAQFSETYLTLAEAQSKEENFRWSLGELKDLAAERATGEALMEAVTIHRTGLVDDDGETLRGHQAARQRALERFSEIDKSLHRLTSPEGDMRQEGNQMREDYSERKHSHLKGVDAGVRFGIENLDAKIGGLQRGDICLVVGSTSVGKTAAVCALGWSACVEQGKNVVFLTTETLRPQVRRKLLARHSKLALFGLVEGLNTRDLKAGTLSAPEELALDTVIRDFTTNPNYGRMQILQVPRGASLATLESKLQQYQREFPIDLVIMDYLRLLRSEKKRQTDREEINSIMVEAKQLATTFNDGMGIPFVSPWQVSRAQQEIATKAGYYTSAALSDSAEASNTADVIVALLAQGENESRHVELRAQVLKNRDGETASGLLVQVDYATAHFSSKGIGGAFGVKPNDGGNPDSFAGLL